MNADVLERMLADAGQAAEWPPAPDMAPAVARHIREERPASVPRRRFRMRRPVALAFAALLLLTAGAAAVPAIRDPILDFLGLRSVKIERVPSLPKLPPKTQAGARLGLGTRTDFVAAWKQVQFTPGLPSGLGNAEVYVDTTTPGGRISLVYRGGKLLLMELEGNLVLQFLAKFIPPGTTVERVMVQGERGLWIHGALHEFAYQDANGEFRTESVRLAGDTLLWRSKGLLMRLEGAKTKAEALRIANSVAPATP
jgi:hypothetical protein